MTSSPQPASSTIIGKAKGGSQEALTCTRLSKHEIENKSCYQDCGDIAEGSKWLPKMALGQQSRFQAKIGTQMGVSLGTSGLLER